MRTLDEYLEVMQSCRVDKGHLTHTDDAHLGVLLETVTHHLVKLGCGTEEERSVDFVYRYSGGEVENLMLRKVGTFGGIQLFAVDTDGGVLHNAAQEYHHCQEKSYLDGDGEVEDDREQEGHDEYPDVSFGVMDHLLDGAPAAHVIAHHDEDCRQTGHRHQ